VSTNNSNFGIASDVTSEDTIYYENISQPLQVGRVVDALIAVVEDRSLDLSRVGAALSLLLSAGLAARFKNEEGKSPDPILVEFSFKNKKIITSALIQCGPDIYLEWQNQVKSDQGTHLWSRLQTLASRVRLRGENQSHRIEVTLFFDFSQESNENTPIENLIFGDQTTPASVDSAQYQELADVEFVSNTSQSTVDSTPLKQILDVVADSQKAEESIKFSSAGSIEESTALVKGAYENNDDFKKVVEGKLEEPDFAEKLIKSMPEEQVVQVLSGGGLPEDELAQVIMRGAPPAQLAETLIRTLPGQEIVRIMKEGLSKEDFLKFLQENLKPDSGGEGGLDLKDILSKLDRLDAVEVPAEPWVPTYEKASQSQVDFIQGVETPVAEVRKVLSGGLPPDVVDAVFSGKLDPSTIAEELTRIISDPVQAKQVAETLLSRVSSESAQKDTEQESEQELPKKVQVEETAQSVVAKSDPKSKTETAETKTTVESKKSDKAQQNEKQPNKEVHSRADAKYELTIAALTQTRKRLEGKLSSSEKALTFYQKRIKELEEKIRTAASVAKSETSKTKRSAASSVEESQLDHEESTDGSTSGEKKTITRASLRKSKEKSAESPTLQGDEMPISKSAVSLSQSGVKTETSTTAEEETFVIKGEGGDVVDQSKNTIGGVTEHIDTAQGSTIIKGHREEVDPSEEVMTVSKLKASATPDSSKPADKSIEFYAKKARELELRLNQAEQKEKSLIQELKKEKLLKSKADETKDPKESENTTELASVDPVSKTQDRKLAQRLQGKVRDLEGQVQQLTKEKEILIRENKQKILDHGSEAISLEPKLEPEESTEHEQVSGRSSDASSLAERKPVQVLSEKVRSLETSLVELKKERDQALQEAKKARIEADRIQGKSKSNESSVPDQVTESSGDEIIRQAPSDPEKATTFYQQKVQELSTQMNALRKAHELEVQNLKKDRLERETPESVRTETAASSSTHQDAAPAATESSEMSVGTDRVVKSLETFQSDIEQLRSEMKDERSRQRVDQLVTQLQTKRSELDQVGKDLSTQLKKKEIQYKNSESVIREELRKTQETLNQTQLNVERYKELTNKLQKDSTEAKSSALNASSNETQFRMRAEQAERRILQLQQELERAARRSDVQVKQTAVTAASSNKEAEFAKKIDSINKAAELKKQEAEALKKKLAEKLAQEAEYKKIIHKLQTDLRVATTKKAA